MMMTGSGIGDVRLALRSLSRSPVLAATAVLTLALGIGANTAMFSVIRGSLLRPLPYAEPGGLVWLSDGHPAFAGPGLDQSVPNLMDLRESSRLMESSAIYRVLSANVATDAGAERVRVLFTSSELLGVLGVRPQLGRDLSDAEDHVDAPPVAILTDALWQSRFGADPDVVGRVSTIDAQPVRIVGVLPSDFTFPGDPALIMPLQHLGAELSRASRGYFAIGRLAPGATVADLRTELQRKFTTLVSDYPEANEGWYTWAEPLRDYAVGRNKGSLLLLGGAVVLVLLIACANVANLLLVRAETRHQELAVRFSLGARRRSLASLFLAEGLVLSGAGALMGVALAYWGTALLVALFGGTLPRASQIGVDGPVLAFATGMAALVGMTVGLVPVLRIRNDGLQTALKDGSRGAVRRASRLGRALVLAEVALAVLVVSGAGLLAHSMWRLQQEDLGVRGEDHVMTFTMSLPAAAYPDGPTVQSFVDRLEARLQRIPGVQSVGFVNRLPLVGGDNTTVAAFDDPDRTADFVSIRFVTPSYFAATGVRRTAGRWLGVGDFDGTSTSVVINTSLARALFDRTDVVGERIAWSGDGGLRVVGVSADIAGGRPERPPPPAFYIPLPTVLRMWNATPRSAGEYLGLGALIRTTGDPRAMVPDFRAAVAGVDPQLPINRVRTLQDIALDRLGTRRFAMSLFGAFAALALTLGAVGIYGVLSFTVAQRSRELGMRLALGASRASVLWLVMREGARLTVPGVLIGVGLALGSSRALGSLLVGVSPLDPWTYAGVTGLLTLVALAAAAVPALRATRTDPLASLRA